MLQTVDGGQPPVPPPSDLGLVADHDPTPVALLDSRGQGDARQLVAEPHRYTAESERRWER